MNVGPRGEKAKPLFQTVTHTRLLSGLGCTAKHSQVCLFLLLIQPSSSHTEVLAPILPKGFLDEQLSGENTVREVVTSWGRNVSKVHLIVFDWDAEWRSTEWHTYPQPRGVCFHPLKEQERVWCWSHGALLWLCFFFFLTHGVGFEPCIAPDYQAKNGLKSTSQRQKV